MKSKVLFLSMLIALAPAICWAQEPSSLDKQIKDAEIYHSVGLAKYNRGYYKFAIADKEI